MLKVDSNEQQISEQKSIISIPNADMSVDSFLNQNFNINPMESNPQSRNSPIKPKIDTIIEELPSKSSLRKNRPTNILTAHIPQDSLNKSPSLDKSPSSVSTVNKGGNSATLKKMFGILGDFGRWIKKNLTIISGKSFNNLVQANIQKIQDKLKFLR